MDSPILIQVEPQFLPDQSSPKEQAYVFAYTITVANTGRVPVQLIARHWIIDDAAGRRQKVRGLGVIGQQPLLAPGQSFRYTSGCQLESPNGTMHGSYLFVTETGEPFEVPIPLFVLDATGHGASSSRILH